MRRLLVLRPEPGASATVAKARAMGLDAISVPLFEVEALAWEAPDAAEFDGVLLTSANAARHGGAALELIRHLPVFAVGTATAEAAREAGLSVAFACDDGIDRLLGSIDPALRLLHLCGEDRRTPVDAQHRITPFAVYRAKAVAAPDLRDTRGAVAMIHSPRAGRRFAELVPDRGSTSVAAISPAAAEAVGGGWAEIESAGQPTDDALLALAARLCDKPPPK